MPNMNVSPAQLQMAASVGVQLLAIDDLQVPLSLSKSGLLGVLEGMLGAIARGELILTEPPKPEEEKPPEGEQKRALESIEGGKQDEEVN